MCAHECLFAQSCLTLCDPMDCSPPGSSGHGILQQRILEWVAMPSSRGSSEPGIKPGSLAAPALSGRLQTVVKPVLLADGRHCFKSQTNIRGKPPGSCLSATDGTGGLLHVEGCRKGHILTGVHLESVTSLSRQHRN